MFWMMNHAVLSQVKLEYSVMMQGLLPYVSRILLRSDFVWAISAEEGKL